MQSLQNECLHGATNGAISVSRQTGQRVKACEQCAERRVIAMNA